MEKSCITSGPDRVTTKGAIWPRDYKTFFMLSSTDHEVSSAHKNKQKKETN